MTEILKPCPFCGSEAKYFQTSSRGRGHGESEDTVGIKCTGCSVAIYKEHWAGYQVQERKDLALEKWNRRVIQERVK